MEAHIYNVNLVWGKDRLGKLSSPELQSEIEVVTPPQFPKGIEGKWSPEHLFTSAVSSCFMTTFLSVAENLKLEFTAFSCNAKGKLEQIEGKFIMSEILLDATLTINNEADAEKAKRILEKSEISIDSG